MATAAKCLEATFSLTGEDEAECIEGVKSFNYLRRLMYRSDDHWISILYNVSKERQVWGRLGKLLQREKTEPTVSENIYHAVVQAILLFEADKWVLTDTMIQNLEGEHVSFLGQVTHK